MKNTHIRNFATKRGGSLILGLAALYVGNIAYRNQYANEQSQYFDIPKYSDTINAAGACDRFGGDEDNDGVCSNEDNCPSIWNPSQNDSDNDGVGDVCDQDGSDDCAGQGGDSDNDGICGNTDNCPTTRNPSQNDSDNDGIGDVCDQANPCANDNSAICNSTTAPFCSGNTLIDCYVNQFGCYVYGEQCNDGCTTTPAGAICDNNSSACSSQGGDSDNDGVCTNDDNCPTIRNPSQNDSDNDGVGDVCDQANPCANDDSAICNSTTAPFCSGDTLVDCYVDSQGCYIYGEQCNDGCTTTPAGAICDNNSSACSNQGGDSDNDGVCTNDDNCPTTRNPSQNDSDNDGIGDVCDQANPCANDDSAICNGTTLPFCSNGQVLIDCYVNSQGCYIYGEQCNDGCTTTPAGAICEPTVNDPCAGQGGDSDNDGVCDNTDNCPSTRNPSQNDSDNDGIGDVCDQANPCANDDYDICNGTTLPFCSNNQVLVDCHLSSQGCYIYGEQCSNGCYTSSAGAHCGIPPSPPPTPIPLPTPSPPPYVPPVDPCANDDFDICNGTTLPFCSQNMKLIDCRLSSQGCYIYGEQCNNGCYTSSAGAHCGTAPTPVPAPAPIPLPTPAPYIPPVDPCTNDDSAICNSTTAPFCSEGKVLIDCYLNSQGCYIYGEQCSNGCYTSSAGAHCGQQGGSSSCTNQGGDSDNDGICNKNDNCPSKPNKDQKDSNGYQDNQGLGDACESVPGVIGKPSPNPVTTPTPIAPTNPCQSKGGDSDGDNICNNSDNCPYTFNPAQLDSNGFQDNQGNGDLCEIASVPTASICIDDDSDGVCNNVDRCPAVAGYSYRQGCNYGGCRLLGGDDDGDWICNAYDQCPNDPGHAQFYGCPADSCSSSGGDTDGDGVCNAFDLCDGLPGAVSNQGCPVQACHNLGGDRDFDGVCGLVDVCPGVRGTPDNNGCPGLSACPAGYRYVGEGLCETN